MQHDSFGDHHDRSGFNTGMLLGLVLGAAAGYFFTTEKGKEILQNLTDNAGEALESLQENEVVQDKLRQAEEAVEHAKEVVDEKLQEVARSQEERKPRLFQRAGNPLRQ